MSCKWFWTQTNLFSLGSYGNIHLYSPLSPYSLFLMSLGIFFLCFPKCLNWIYFPYLLLMWFDTFRIIDGSIQQDFKRIFPPTPSQNLHNFTRERVDCQDFHTNVFLFQVCFFQRGYGCSPLRQVDWVAKDHMQPLVSIKITHLSVKLIKIITVSIYLCAGRNMKYRLGRQFSTFCFFF